MTGFEQEAVEFFRRFQTKLPTWPATLGDGAGNVEVAGKAGWVYVRMPDGPVVQAYNGGRVPALEGQGVYVGYERYNTALLQVLSLRQVDQEGAAFPNLGLHAHTHTWLAGGGGYDVVWVDARQWLPLRIGLKGAFTVAVFGSTVVLPDGSWRWVDDVIDLADSVPSSGARWALLYLDEAAVLQVKLGAEQAAYADLDTTNLPTLPARARPLAAVALYAGQVALQESAAEQNVLDLRFSGAGSSSGGSGAGDKLYLHANFV